MPSSPLTGQETFAGVIERHRHAMGLQASHVSLGERATPQALDATLSALHADLRLFATFRPEEIALARTARLEALIERIHGLAAEGRSDDIRDLTEMIPDHDIEPDLAWMVADSQRRGEALPKGVA